MKHEAVFDPPVRGLRPGMRFELTRIDSDGLVFKALDALGTYEYGKVHIDTARMIAEEAGVPVHLTPTEWEVLTALVTRYPLPMSKRELEMVVWGFVDNGDNVRVVVDRLRKAFKASFICTLHSYGYRLIGPNEPEAPRGR